MAKHKIIKQLIQLRKEAGLTQKELAVKMGVSLYRVRQIEQRPHSISIDTLEKYTQACEKQIEYKFK